MAAAADWNTLLQQSADLVGQDFSNVPRVERSLPQLQQYADALRSRTNRYRGPEEQAAATRLLAQQGFDASRLTSEVVGLEIVPTIEDVFHAETSSVEEYLQQVEEATLLAAIQEAQEESNASFEAYMDQCMTRDWAANKRRLFGLIAPSGMGTIGGGPQPLIGRSGTGDGGQVFASPALRLSPKETAYVDMVKKMAVAAGSHGGGQTGLEIVKGFKEACEKHEDKPGGQDFPMSSIWGLLVSVLGEARRRNVTPSAAGHRYVEALVAGARKHLEDGHQRHMRTTITRYKLVAERGPDPDSLRDVQAYVQVKFRDRGPLDFATPNGMDTSWIQLFYCLRSGYDRAAARIAERCGDLLLLTAGGRAGGGVGVGGSMRPLVEEWTANGCRLSERSAVALAREAERLLRDKNGLRQSPRAPYQALAAGLPAILSTIEDFMWARLALAGGGAGGPGAAGTPAAGVASYTLTEVQADINRWPPQYYSKQNREPLAFVMVLLLSLQWAAAVRFLWRDDTTKPYRLDAVHMGLALQAEGALAVLNGVGECGAADGAAAAGPGSAAADVATMAVQYSRKFVTAGDSGTALYYRWLAAMARGGSLAVKGAMLRELLVGGRDFGTLLGGGGAGARGALHALVPDTEERRRLFEGVAYECQMSAQPEEAVELYLAADRPVSALALINGQMSAAIAAAVDEAVAQPSTPAGASTPSMERLERIARSGRAAVERLSGSRAAAAAAPSPTASAAAAAIIADPTARRELEAFQQLGVIRDMLLAAKRGRHDQALQRLSELPFIPTERSRLDLCVRMSTQLHPAIAERLQDVIATAADSIAARRQAVGRDAVGMLAAELAVITQYANSLAGARLPQ
ncbi:hypothetical protein VOLCADRAFT_120776, partial [Volvox carteri f. nagariensis]